ncbi:MAG: single-strand DNA-binding protein, partial [Campylobacterota bacterium]|nr:single-strand DNA-binding protein [Campylobacterota bacterium]
SKHSVVVETMQMLDSKGGNQGSADEYPAQQSAQQDYQQPSYQQQKPQSYQKPSAQQMPSSNSIPVIDIDEDEIPF